MKLVELTSLEVPGKIEVALLSILGFSAKGVMKLRGWVKGQHLIVLIDSIATHNFIHQRLVDELNLPIIEESKFGVTIGDETMREGSGICRRVEVVLVDIIIVANFLAIELGNMDVILGMQWLLMMGSWGYIGRS